jgi:hypothetical protein
MKLQIEFWELLSMMVSVLLAILGVFMAIIKSMLAQSQRHLDMRFASLEAANKTAGEQLAKRLELIEQAGRNDADQWARVEREVLQLKAELPLNYVRREDYVQAMATIMAKLDAMSMRFENLLLKESKRVQT